MHTIKKTKLPKIPLVVITNLKQVNKILALYRTELPVEGKCRYRARMFSYLLSSNLNYKGEYLFMKIKKYISFRNNGFEYMLKIFNDLDQKSIRI